LVTACSLARLRVDGQRPG